MQYTLAITVATNIHPEIYPTNVIDKARGKIILIEAQIMLSNLLVALSAVYSVGVCSDSARSILSSVDMMAGHLQLYMYIS